MKPNLEPTVNNYQTSSPRVVISVAAVAMAALTLCLSVLPAGTSSDTRLQSIAKEVSRGNLPAVDVAERDGSPMVVYGLRDPETGLRKVSAPHVVPPRKQQI